MSDNGPAHFSAGSDAGARAIIDVHGRRSGKPTSGPVRDMSRHPFDLLMELDTQHIRLDCAALHLARDVYPKIDVPRYLRLLDEMAAAVMQRRPGLAATLRYEALRDVLVGEFGLSGNARDYYAPENSYLNRVLDTRVGIPISLAVVWLEVARRLKWPAAGVGLPGHFLVRLDDPERFVLADPFHAGVARSVDDCRLLVAERFQGAVELSPRHLRRVSTRGVLVRLLRNLRNIYLAAEDWPRLASTLRRLAAVQPSNGRHLRELAAVFWRQGDVRGARNHLALYLHRLPDARDSSLVERSLRKLDLALVAQN